MRKSAWAQLLGAAIVTLAIAATASAQSTPSTGVGALAPSNIAKSRAKAPFDLTGTWLHSGGPGNNFRFSPPADAKLTPFAQGHLDASKKAAAEGKAYHDDIGACWPAGMPIIMTRVWPIAMVQTPTEIFMISSFMNSTRFIFMDGRQHTDPDVVVRSWNGESIGHWEGDTLVIDTRNFVDDHHWIDNGVPATDALRIVERVKLIDQGKNLEIAYTISDPKSFSGEWNMTKKFRRVDDTDVIEASCLPDLNEHLPSTKNVVREGK
jgi:hypothetical protein